MAKRHLSILFLGIFILNLSGVYFLFKVEQAYIRRSIKREIKAGIPEDELHLFKLLRSDYQKLNWIRPDAEFRSGKRMFDVVRSVEDGDSIHLYCVNDVEEAALFSRLDELTRQRMAHGSNHPDRPLKKVVKVLKQLFLSDHSSFNKCMVNFHASHFFGRTEVFYSPPCIELLTPPPNVF